MCGTDVVHMAVGGGWGGGWDVGGWCSAGEGGDVGEGGVGIVGEDCEDTQPEEGEGYRGRHGCAEACAHRRQGGCGGRERRK